MSSKSKFDFRIEVDSTDPIINTFSLKLFIFLDLVIFSMAIKSVPCLLTFMRKSQGPTDYIWEFGTYPNESIIYRFCSLNSRVKKLLHRIHERISSAITLDTLEALHSLHSLHIKCLL